MPFLRFIALVVFVTILSVGLATSNQSEASDEDFNATKWVNAWVEIWNTYDLDQVDRLFLQDARVSYFSSEKEGAVIGIDAVREHHRGFGFVEGGKDQPNKLWLEDLHTSTFEDSTVVTGIWFFQRSDGTLQRGPVTIVYVKKGGEFRIAHMHFANYPEKNDKEESKS